MCSFGHWAHSVEEMGKAVPEGRDELYRSQDQSGSTTPGQERRGVKRDSEVYFLMNRKNNIK